jgi:vitamin B12 transporter
MNKNRSFVLLLLLLAGWKLSTLEISGTVYNNKSEVIENVIINYEGKITLSNKQGRFLIKEISEDSEVRFHKIGYHDLNIIADEVPSEITMDISPIEMEGTRITAGSRELELPENVDKKVIELEDIPAGYDLAGILGTEGGLQISGTGLTGESRYVIIPGYKAKHTLIMLDGTPLNKPGEAFDISTIPVEIIDNIEIYKSSSLTEGSGSLAGVINLNTKKSSGPNSISINQILGSFGKNNSIITISTSLKSSSFLLNLSRRTADNDFKYEAKEYWDAPDSLRIRKYNDKKFYDLNFLFRNSRFVIPISYSLHYQDLFKKLPGPTNNPELFENSRLTGSTFRHTLSLEKNFGRFNFSSDLHYFLENTRYDNTRIDEMYHSFLDYYVLNKNNYSNKGWKSVLNYRKNYLNIGLILDLSEQTFKYVEITDEEDSIPLLKDQNAAAGCRLDYEHSVFPFTFKWHSSGRFDRLGDDQQFSYNLSPVMVYHSNFDLQLGASISRGFTVPSFYELYWKGDTQAVGNPDLQPETNNSRQVFLKLDYKDSYFKISCRHDEIADMIIWFPDFNKTWKPLNISGAEIDDISISTRIFFCSAISFDANIDRTYSKDRSKTSDGEHTSYWGTDIIYMPEYLINLNLNFSYQRFGLILNYKGTGEQWPTRDQLSEELKLPTVDLFNANLYYIWTISQWHLKCGVLLNNLTDEMYEIYEYSPQPGFNWETNLSVKYIF